LAVAHLQLGLCLPVRAQQRHGLISDVDRATGVGLRRAEDRMPPRLEKLPNERDGGSVKVHVRPPQAAQFTLPGAGIERERGERRELRPRLLRGLQERPGLVRRPAVLADGVVVAPSAWLADNERRDIPHDESLEDGRLQRAAQDRVVLRQRAC
jgi:hypothetical protein